MHQVPVSTWHTAYDCDNTLGDLAAGDVGADAKERVVVPELEHVEGQRGGAEKERKPDYLPEPHVAPNRDGATR